MCPIFLHIFREKAWRVFLWELGNWVDFFNSNGNSFSWEYIWTGVLSHIWKTLTLIGKMLWYPSFLFDDSIRQWNSLHEMIFKRIKEASTFWLLVILLPRSSEAWVCILTLKDLYIYTSDLCHISYDRDARDSPPVALFIHMASTEATSRPRAASIAMYVTSSLFLFFLLLVV